MGVIGSDHRYTAMAKTVGLPLGITAIQMLNNKFNLKGIQIPIHKDIYEIVLKELNEYGIHFKERECEYLGYNPEVIGL
jgi:saccharopine dehydrogenase (NAD+, L-glutamate forming)